MLMFISICCKHLRMLVETPKLANHNRLSNQNKNMQSEFEKSSTKFATFFKISTDLLALRT